MQKRIRTTFKDEEASSLQFMEKLSQFKQTALETKKKNSLQIHKAEWIKEWQKMAKQEGNLSSDVGYCCMQIDKQVNTNHTDGDKEDTDDTAASMFTLNEELDRKRRIEKVNMKYQVENFRDIVKELKGKDKRKIDINEMKDLYQDIKQYLTNISEAGDSEYQDVIRSDSQNSKLVDDNITNQQVNIDSDALIEVETALAETEEEEDYYKGGIGKCRLQILLERDSPSKDEEDIVHHLVAYQGDISLAEERKLLDQYKKTVDLLKQRYILEVAVVEEEHEGKGRRRELPGIFQNENCFLEFKHIWKCYFGKARELFIERLQLHFQKVKRLQLDVMESVLQNEEFRRQKLGALFRAYNVEKRELTRKAEQQIQDMIQFKLEESKKRAERLALREEQLRIEEELNEKREEYSRKERIKQEQKQKEEAEREQAEEKKRQIYEQHAKEVRLKAREYEEKRKQEAAEIIEKEKQLKERLEAELKQQIIESKGKVDERQAKDKERREERKEKKELDVRMKELNQERIEQAIEGFSFRPQVQQDFNRLKQPTKAMIIKSQTKYDKADQIPLTKVHGFTVNQLMKDMRYKLSSALADAGLQNTEYAHNVLRYIHN